MKELLAVLSLTIFATISPGPDFAIVSRNSLLLSRRAGVLTALGVGLSLLLHVAYTLLGVGLIMHNNLWLFHVLKFSGALYLIWLGFKMLQSQKQSPEILMAVSPSQSSKITPIMDFSALRMGFLTKALNPKATIFVVSLFMQVVDPTTALVVQLAYGLFISLTPILWFTLVALFFSTSKIQAHILKLRHWIDRFFGGLLIGFGILS